MERKRERAAKYRAIKYGPAADIVRNNANFET